MTIEDFNSVWAALGFPLGVKRPDPPRSAGQRALRNIETENARLRETLKEVWTRTGHPVARDALRRLESGGHAEGT